MALLPHSLSCHLNIITVRLELHVIAAVKRICIHMQLSKGRLLNQEASLQLALLNPKSFACSLPSQKGNMAGRSDHSV